MSPDPQRELDAARAEAAKIIAEAQAEAARIRRDMQAWVDRIAAQVEQDRAEILAEARAEAGIDDEQEPGTAAEGAWQRFGRT